MLDEALDRRSARLSAGDDKSQGLTAEDFQIQLQPDTLAEMAKEKEELDAEIAGLVGMKSGTDYFAGITAKIEWQLQSGNSKQMKNKSYNMVLVGKAGTGKPTWSVCTQCQ